MNEFIEFYPTPKDLMDKIIKDFGIDLKKYYYILEPSAGKGDLIDYFNKHHKIYQWQDSKADIDCIEVSENLRGILQSKNYRVVYDDFLNFNTFKHYDLILMNPPFSNGDSHLLKAIEMIENGGDCICILNAQTIKNPFTAKRKELMDKLDQYSAKIKYYQSSFATAERTTDVEVAAIYISIQKEMEEPEFLKDMKTKAYNEFQEKGTCTELAFGDSIKNAIIQYNIDIAAGIHLLKEYHNLSENLKYSFMDGYSSSIIDMKIGDEPPTVNNFVQKVRRKYWEALFKNPDFTKQMTSEIQKKYSSRINELTGYDFSEYNIREIKIDLTKNLIKSVEDSILTLFEELTEKHSWYPECDKNIHYYNGWASNKAWIINKKVVIPLDAYTHWSYNNTKELDYKWGFKSKLMDIEKVLNYLDTKDTPQVDMDQVLTSCQSQNITKRINLKHFYITVYKKGTCHIEFKDNDLLKKFNIYGSQHRGWLPPSYGKKKYEEMTAYEQEVIDSFEGKESYEETLRKKDYYICNNITNNLLLS